ncbi:MAG: hypothetical protein QXU32_11250 [Nitrososphaerales archaeon]
MSSWLDVKTLYNALCREIENETIQYVEPNAYRDIANMLSSLKGQGYDGIEAKVKDVLTLMISEMVTLLIRIRLDKIKNNSTNYSNLTDEEQFIVAAKKNLNLCFDQVLSAVLDGRVMALEGISMRVKTMHVLLRFLRPMESMLGVDDKRYGPFQEEDIAILPFENAKPLIEKGIVIELPWLDE